MFEATHTMKYIKAKVLYAFSIQMIHLPWRNTIGNTVKQPMRIFDFNDQLDLLELKSTVHSPSFSTPTTQVCEYGKKVQRLLTVD